MDVETILQSKKGAALQTIPRTASAVSAVSRLNEHRIGVLIVVDGEGRIAGILSERDILRHFDALESSDVGDIMTPRDKLVIAHRNDTLNYCMTMFTKNRIRHLPVMEDEAVAGIVSIGDIVKAMLDDAEYENKLLKDYIYGY